MVHSCDDVIIYCYFLPKRWGRQLHSWIRSYTVGYAVAHFLLLGCAQLHAWWSAKSVLCVGWNQCNCISFCATAYHDVVTNLFYWRLCSYILVNDCVLFKQWANSLSEKNIQTILIYTILVNHRSPKISDKKMIHRSWKKSHFFNNPYSFHREKVCAS